ncbi:MAG: hypothetical protein AUG85_04720 [Gemmatimonadetes bacterium 13_1_20CM_4_66_11]|nr:MAG: hypothetical protein AUG85_04720 [Gemmatimonadetes bacterium 13_1_20CM_4_66_11]
MRENAPSRRPPLVLIVSNQEWSSRSLETILAPNGYAVLRAYTAASAMARARGAQPDIIVVDSTLPDSDGLELCRKIRRDRHVPLGMPIFIIGPEPPTRQRRIDALRAGAWEHLGQPLDAEEFLLRIEAFVRAKLEADRARAEGLVDEATGLYNMRGLARRARELGSQASRQHAALACVVFAPDFDTRDRDAASEEALTDAAQRLAGAFKAAGRLSDAIGRVGPSEFAVVAIGTDAPGSVKLAERVAQALAAVPALSATTRPFELRAGYYTVPDFHSAPVDTVDALLRATAALRLARTDPRGGWLRQFENAS